MLAGGFEGVEIPLAGAYAEARVAADIVDYMAVVALGDLLDFGKRDVLIGKACAPSSWDATCVKRK